MERDERRRVVEVAGKVEDERLQHRIAAAEDGPAAEARDAVAQRPVLAEEAHSVDAVRQRERRIESHVSRRVAELASALVAVHDRA